MVTDQDIVILEPAGMKR